MTELQLADNRSVDLDEHGFLLHYQQWNASIAEALAAQENIELTPAHWEILLLLRQYFEQFDSAPAMRALVKFVARELGKEQGNSLYLLKLFPGSPAKLASRIAGLPKPDNCL